jgi:hypothetical protein
VRTHVLRDSEAVARRAAEIIAEQARVAVDARRRFVSRLWRGSPTTGSSMLQEKFGFRPERGAAVARELVGAR